MEEDGSLRNGGKEFVLHPLNMAEALSTFKEVHKRLECYPDLKFSERTSIHVHVNMCPYEVEQVKNIVLWYALLEQFFFMQVDPARRNNIHCVALTDTYLPIHYFKSLGDLRQRWHKYTALNIKPLTQYGTIEFRHSEGHEDPIKLENWLKVLDNLVQLGINVPVDVNNTRAMMDGFCSVFAHTPTFYHFNTTAAFQVTAFNQIIDLKLSK
jgi:hypothetical protein